MNTQTDITPIGLLGGAFDPIHYGHLRIALESLHCLNLSEVWFIPSHIPPHKALPSASPQQRTEMLKLALENEPRFKLCELETQKTEISYTIDTLKSLRQQVCKQTSLCFLLGHDAFNQFHTWHQWQDILNYCHLIVITRPGYGTDPDEPLKSWSQARLTGNPQEISDSPCGKIHKINMPCLDISSTLIRHQIAHGHSPKYLLPDKVLDYIHQQTLYYRREQYSMPEPTTPHTVPESLQPLLNLVYEALEDLKAQDIQELFISDISSIADMMIVASGTSNRHVKAIAEAITEKTKAHGYQPMSTTGLDTAEWVLVDLGDIIVHVMLPQTRNFYELEKLWSARPS